MRSTFGCLNFEGYPANEKQMHYHERFDVESTLRMKKLCAETLSLMLRSPNLFATAGAEALINHCHTIKATLLNLLVAAE